MLGCSRVSFHYLFAPFKSLITASELSHRSQIHPTVSPPKDVKQLHRCHCNNKFVGESFLQCRSVSQLAAQKHSSELSCAIKTACIVAVSVCSISLSCSLSFDISPLLILHFAHSFSLLLAVCLLSPCTPSPSPSLRTSLFVPRLTSGITRRHPTEQVLHQIYLQT